jgi:site-specific recombinase XerC
MRSRQVSEVLAFAGLRFGELAALRVGRVNLLQRRIEVAESVTEVNGVTVFGPQRPTTAGRCPSRGPWSTS